MVEGIANHPGWEDLRAYGQGRLSSDATAALEAHLAGCASCCELLEKAPADSFLGRLRAADSAAGSESVRDTTADAFRVRGPEPHAVPPELIGHPRYHVHGLIGHGGMGAVYRAEHLRMGRPVALKVIHPGLMQNPAAVERFHQEVRAAAQLHHPNIVTAFDADQAGGLHFLVMEYVEGTSLADLVQRRGPLPVAEACDYVRQAALGLQHAHEKGMVHRDVKPHNLMRTNDGEVKILDFGLARVAHTAEPPAAGCAPAVPLTGAGVVMGTADYIAPEQAADPRSADIRADVYALGCTLFHLLAGRPPFPDGTVAEKLARHADTPLPSPGTDVLPGLAAVLARMTAKRPADRYGTPGEVAVALAPFCVKGGPRQPHAGRRLLVAGALVLLAAGLTCAAVVWLRTHRDQGGGPADDTGPSPIVGNVNHPQPASPDGVAPGPSVRSHEPPPPPMSEAEAEETIKGLGGRLTRNETVLGRPVTGVILSRTQVSDADLRAVAAFPQLKALDLGYTQVGDEGLKHLAGLTRLRTLMIDGTRVTDAGMPCLGGLKNLSFLGLGKTKVTDTGLKCLIGLSGLTNLILYHLPAVSDEGVRSLAAMEKLISLDLRGTRVTDDGLRALSGHKRLVSLQVRGPGVTDAGVRALRNLKGLQHLDLSDTAVTDDGVREVVEHDSLFHLSLSGARNVTDAGVKHLADLEGLKVLSLARTGVTDAGVRVLAERMPQLEFLALSETEVTDASLRALEQCPNLRVLNLVEARKVTKAGIAKLKKARPGLRFQLKGPLSPDE